MFYFIYCYFTQLLNALIIKSNSNVTYLFLDNAFLFSDSTCFLEKWGNGMAYFKSRTPRGSCTGRVIDMNGNANV